MSGTLTFWLGAEIRVIVTMFTYAKSLGEVEEDNLMKLKVLNFLQSKNTNLARKEKTKIEWEIRIKNGGKETLLIHYINHCANVLLIQS